MPDVCLINSKTHEEIFSIVSKELRNRDCASESIVHIFNFKLLNKATLNSMFYMRPILNTVIHKAEK